jgi:hypothetical protein
MNTMKTSIRGQPMALRALRPVAVRRAAPAIVAYLAENEAPPAAKNASGKETVKIGING